MKYFLTVLALLVIALPAFAKDAPDVTEDDATVTDVLEDLKNAPKDTSSVYGPDNCDFQMTFPEEPYTAKRCPNGIDNKCYQLTNYTMVYDMQTSVDISVSCVASPPENYERYNERVIKAALAGMVSAEQLEEYEIYTKEEDGIRVGSILGGQDYNNQPGIYNAQLWVGPNSILTVEGKLVGNEHKEADESFTKIIGSIKQKAD